MTLAAAPHRLEERYFEQMASSLGDKARLLPFIVGERVLDVGAGGGGLAEAIAARGHRVTVLDNTADSLQRLRRAGISLEVLEGYADQIGHLGAGTFDTIVLSSVMHEVYSYGASTGELGYAAVSRTLAELRQALRPGGRLIIRDGVLPPDWLAAATVRVPDDELVAEYLELSPHPELRLDRNGSRLWSGTKHAVGEMLLTVTWGAECLPREALERFQLYTADGYVTELAPAFDLVHVSAVTQPGYREQLAGYDARDALNMPWFPATNGLWVFQLRLG